MPKVKNSLFTFFVIFSFFHFISVYSEQNNIVMFVFGDSLFDPGNLNYRSNLSASVKANHIPYGETFFNFSTGRFSDGRIIPDFIAMDMKLPLWKPYLGPNGTHLHNYTNGANFAAGGAGVIYSVNQVSLTNQLNFFKDVAEELREQKGKNEANEILKKAIYFSSIGGIDYDNFIEENNNSSPSQKQAYVDMVIGNFTIFIKEIYEIGGRKFAFQNVGPMGCLPRIKEYFGVEGDECVEAGMELAQLHNNALLKTVADLENQLDGFKYSVFDYYIALYDLIRNHTQYDFKVVDSACCGRGSNNGLYCGAEPYYLCKNTSEYLFFDGHHPTERANIILSKLMWNESESTLSIPYDFRHLYELNITISNHHSWQSY